MLFNFVNTLPGRIAITIKELKSPTSKLQKTASSIGFIEHALYHQITPKFANVKGQFLHRADKWKAEKSIPLSHLKTHKKSVKNLSIRYNELMEKLKRKIGELLSNFIVVHLNNVLCYINTKQFSIKNKKLFHLKKKILPINVISSTRVPVINLSDYDFDMEGLKYGLHHFVDKSKSVKRNIAVELENIAHLVQKDISSENMEYFLEYLRKMTNKFSQNIYHTKDDTYCNLRHLIQNNDIALLAGDNDSLVVVMNKKDFILKVGNMINEGIQQGKYEWTNDTIHKDLEKFQHCLYHNFKNHLKYSDM